MAINYKDHFSFNQYDTMKLTEKEWNKDINKHITKYTELKDTEVINTSEIDYLLENNYSIWFVVKNENPYFHKDCYLVDFYLRYANKPITVYINKDYFNKITDQEPEKTEASITKLENNETYTVKQTSFTNQSEAVQYCNDNDFDPELMLNGNKEQIKVESIYWYDYKLRGFSIGCQPKGHIEVNENIGRHGIVAYNRPLTEIELNDYDLQPHHAIFKAVS